MNESDSSKFDIALPREDAHCSVQFIQSRIFQSETWLPWHEKDCVIIVSQTVAKLYLQPLLAAWPTSLRYYVMPDGEAAKDRQVAFDCLDQLLKWRCHRGTVLIAFGGGTISDVVGFVASIFMRGIAYVSIPTTLLAMVDSCIGGKTAINHSLGKNLLGSFHHPTDVMMDVSVLGTVPQREYRAGLAEVIKYGLIMDADFFNWLEEHIFEILAPGPAIQEVIQRCCNYKAQLVGQDEYDVSLRRHLNFGHTFAHALERLTHYKMYLHGEAVAIGMMCAVQFSIINAGLSAECLPRLQKLLAFCGLPTALPDEIIADDFLGAMLHDKKVTEKGQQLVILKSIGTADVISLHTDTMLMELFNYYEKN